MYMYALVCLVRVRVRVRVTFGISVLFQIDWSQRPGGMIWG